MITSCVSCGVEELDGPTQRSQRSMAQIKAKQRSQRSVIGWETNVYYLTRAHSCFERHVKPLVPAAFAIVSSSLKES
jgi:hypothetical protein